MSTESEKQIAQNPHKSTAKGTTYGGVLGEMIWLLSRSKTHSFLFIRDLDWYLLPALFKNQYRIYKSKNRPVGLVLWAYVSPEVDTRLADGISKLQPRDWHSGDILWIYDVVAPFGKSEGMVTDTLKTALLGKEVKLRRTNPDGKSEIITMRESPSDSANKAQDADAGDQQNIDANGKHSIN